MKKKLLSALLAASLIASSVMSLGAWAVEPETTFTKGDQTYKVLTMIEDFEDTADTTVHTHEESADKSGTVSATQDGEYKATWADGLGGFYHHGFELPETDLDGEGLTFELTTSKALNPNAANTYLGLTRATDHNFGTNSSDSDPVWGFFAETRVVPTTLVTDPATVAGEDSGFHYRVMVPYADLGDVENLSNPENGTICLHLLHNLYMVAGGLAAGDYITIDNIATYEEVTEEEEEPPAEDTKEVTYGGKTYTITVEEDCEGETVEGNPWQSTEGWLKSPAVATVPDGNKAFGGTQDASSTLWGGVSVHLKDVTKVTGDGVYVRVYMATPATLNSPEAQKNYAVVVKDYVSSPFTNGIEALPYAIFNTNDLDWKKPIASYWNETDPVDGYTVADVLIPFEDLKSGGKAGTTPDTEITEYTFEQGVEVGIAFGKWAFANGNVPTGLYVDDIGFYTVKDAEVSSEETSSEETSSDESSEEVSSGETSSDDTSSETPTSNKKRLIYDTFENWKNDLSLRSGVKHGSESNCWSGNNYDTISLDKETPAVGEKSFKISTSSTAGRGVFFRLYHQIDDKVTLKKIAEMLAAHQSDPDHGAAYARANDDTVFTFYAKATGDLENGSWTDIETEGDPLTSVQMQIGFTTNGAGLALEGIVDVTNEWQKFEIPLTKMSNAPGNITTENDAYANWSTWKGVTDTSRGDYPSVAMNSLRVNVLNKTNGTTLYLDNIGFEGSNLTPGFEFDYKYDNLAEEPTHYEGVLEDIPPVDEELNKYGDTSSDVSSDTSSDTSSETPSFDADAAMNEFYNLEGEKWMVENFESYDSFDKLSDDYHAWYEGGKDLSKKSTQPLQDYYSLADDSHYAVTNDLLDSGINSKTYQFKKDTAAGDRLYPRLRMRVNNTMADADGNHLFGDGIAVDVTTTVAFGLKVSLLAEPFSGEETQSSEKQVTVAENGGKVTVYFPWTDFMSGDGTLDKLNRQVSRWMANDGVESFLIGLLPTIGGMEDGDTVLMDNIRFYTAAPEGMAADIEALAKTEGDANYNAVRDFLSAAYDSLKAEDGTMTGTETQYAALQELIDELKPDAPKKGDLNGDGEVTIADALQALRYSVGLDNAADLTAEQIAVGDMNADGKITAVDALMILRMAVGLPV